MSSLLSQSIQNQIFSQSFSKVRQSMICLQFLVTIASAFPMPNITKSCFSIHSLHVYCGLHDGWRPGISNPTAISNSSRSSLLFTCPNHLNLFTQLCTLLNILTGDFIFLLLNYLLQSQALCIISASSLPPHSCQKYTRTLCALVWSQ